MNEGTAPRIQRAEDSRILGMLGKKSSVKLKNVNSTLSILKLCIPFKPILTVTTWSAGPGGAPAGSAGVGGGGYGGNGGPGDGGGGSAYGSILTPSDLGSAGGGST